MRNTRKVYAEGVSRYDPEARVKMTVGDIVPPGTKVDFEPRIVNGTLSTPLFSPAERAFHWALVVVVALAAIVPPAVCVYVTISAKFGVAP